MLSCSTCVPLAEIAPLWWYSASCFANLFSPQASYAIHPANTFQSYNPGNLSTELQRHARDAWPAIGLWILDQILYPAVFGAYTELYCGLSQDLTTAKDQGAYVVPWGRKWGTRSDLEGERGEATARRLYEWCDEKTKKYA